MLPECAQSFTGVHDAHEDFPRAHQGFPGAHEGFPKELTRVSRRSRKDARIGWA